MKKSEKFINMRFKVLYYLRVDAPKMQILAREEIEQSGHKRKVNNLNIIWGVHDLIPSTTKGNLFYSADSKEFIVTAIITMITY